MSARDTVTELVRVTLGLLSSGDPVGIFFGVMIVLQPIIIVTASASLIWGWFADRRYAKANAQRVRDYAAVEARIEAELAAEEEWLADLHCRKQAARIKDAERLLNEGLGLGPNREGS